MPSEPVEVSVLIPFLNEERHLPRTAPRMLGQRFDGTIEFLFVDSGSSDRSREIVERLAARDERVRLLDNPGRTVARALNVGLRAARGRYVARMDAHTFYPEDYIAEGVRRLERGDVDWVSGPALPCGEGKWSRRIALALRTWLGTGGVAYRIPPEAAEEVEVDSGFTGLWRRDTLVALGGWDKDAVVNEDGELASRFRARGMRIVMLRSMAAHYVPRDSLGALWRQYYRYGQGRARTASLHGNALRPAHALPPLVTLALLVAVAGPRPVRTLARLAVTGWAAALVATAAASSRHAEPRTDALWLPAILATMHVAWGLGFLRGSLRHGPPRIGT